MTDTTVAAPAGDTRQTTTATTTTTDPAALNPGAAGGHQAATSARPTENGGAALDAGTARGWSENWRELYAGEDPKMLARLQRYTTPKAAIDAMIAAQNRISSGELRSQLPATPTPEQVAEYRQQNGIPEKPDGYFEKLPDGLVIGDDDKPMFESFAKGLHALNAPPQIAQYAVKWYNDFQEEQAARVSENDLSQKATAEDSLRAEWGTDYRANISHITNFLRSAPEGVADLVTNARGADGRAILNDPKVVQWFASVAREMNPVGTIVGSGDSMKTVENRMGELTKMMGNQSSEYWKGPTAEKLQAEFRDLVDAQNRLKARGVA